jgi:cytoskeletal protein CcmA (bactofilin family)
VVAGGKTTIAAGSRVKGDVIGETELVIEGTVEGVVRVDNRVEVGARGEVHGQILAQSVRIGGKVYGNVAGKDRVEVLLSGALQGDVHSPKVSIAEGGFFKGNIDMSEVTGKIVPKADAPKAEAPKPEPAKTEPAGGAQGGGGDKGRKDK